jgi:hypothetical protein
VTNVVLLNLGLFLPVALAGIATTWFGWVLAGRGGDEDVEGGLSNEHAPLHPDLPSPVEPGRSARLDDLARSA